MTFMKVKSACNLIFFYFDFQCDLNPALGGLMILVTTDHVHIILFSSQCIKVKIFNLNISFIEIQCVI